MLTTERLMEQIRKLHNALDNVEDITNSSWYKNLLNETQEIMNQWEDEKPIKAPQSCKDCINDCENCGH